MDVFALQKCKFFMQLPFLSFQVLLRYLIGMLYVNFSLVWEPVSEIIR